ncbi:hypothetical protein UT300005_03650 [Clostridium sp. CTA-5]
MNEESKRTIYYNTETRDYIILFEYKGEYYIIKIAKCYRELVTVKDYTNTNVILNPDVRARAEEIIAEENNIVPLGLLTRHGTALQILRAIQYRVSRELTISSET